MSAMIKWVGIWTTIFWNKTAQQTNINIINHYNNKMWL